MYVNLIKQINGKAVIGEIKVRGIRYYMDTDKSIFADSKGEYVKVLDEEIIREILEKFTAHSLDAI